MLASPETFFEDKAILITGGTGSFGRVFAKRLLQIGSCRKVIIFSRDEWKQWEMQQSDPLFRHSKIRYFLGDVRDIDRLKRAFKEVDIVVHAAALKQVPAAEYNPTEFIKTNVQGAMNVIDAAIDCEVNHVIALSTDKAVNPVNLYGATKLCSDKLFIAGNAYVGAKGFPSLSVVRYGNVSNSRGSVLPYWKGLIATGAKEIPITDENMSRFWITLEDSVQFVIDCLIRSQGGEIFVPKIPSFKIVELAKALAPDLPLNRIGIRPGEKIAELLISKEESRHTLDCPTYFSIIQEEIFQDKQRLQKFIRMQTNPSQTPLPLGFEYSSDKNPQWLNRDDLKQLIKEV